MIRFESILEQAVMSGPGGEPMVQEIEHRKGPLTSSVASVNTFLGEKAKAFLGTADTAFLSKLQDESKANCPFCVAHERGTRFPETLCNGGLVRRGDSVGVPNLFSKAGLDAVVVVSHRQHTLFPSRIPAADFVSAVQVGIDLIRRARRVYGLAHHVLGMNFLHPGGSSVPHPHLQAIARGIPYSGVERIVGLSAAYKERHGANYWRELLETERAGGGRHLGGTGGVEWVVPFAPAHQKEVWGIFSGAGSLLELDDAAAEDFATGIWRLASFYEREGHHSYTMAFFSAPDTGLGDHFAVQARLCARPAFKPLYSNYDTWFAPKLIGDEVHTQAPEEYAERMRRLIAAF